MASARFWKEREEEFRRHANDENNSLAADWYSITDSWTFRDGSVGRSERIFKSLARKAARGLKGNLVAEACTSWLDALRHGKYGFELWFHHGGAYNEQRLNYLKQSGECVPVVEGVRDTFTFPDGSAEIRTLFEGITGTIERVFETSADFCLELGCHTPPAPDASVTETPGGSPMGAANPNPQANKWKDIEISFLSDERVQITIGAQTGTRNYAEMGFASKRNGTAVLAWHALRTMAEAEGVIMVASDGRKWAQVEKRMQEIRNVLRQQFGLTDDPVPYIKKTPRNRGEFGYRTKFKLSCGRSYQS